MASKVALSKHFDVLLPIVITKTPLTHLSSVAVPFESIALHSKLKIEGGGGNEKPMGDDNFIVLLFGYWSTFLYSHLLSSQVIYFKTLQRQDVQYLVPGVMKCI